MLTVDEIYRGYRIVYHRNQREAYIFPPRGGLALETIPTATKAEGLEVLRQRARAAIDADISRSG